MTADIASGGAGFGELHAKLCGRELPQARRDADRLADMLSALVEALGLTIAVGSQGDPTKANELAEGVTARIFEAVAENAGIAALARRSAP